MLSLNVFSLFTCAILISTKISVVQGKYVLWPKIQRSIAQYKVITTWDNAKRHCDSQGAILASPIDAGLLKYMKSIIGVNNHTTPYFIGIKARRNAELQFVSEEGILLEDISEAAIYMIDQLDPRIGDCLCMDQYNIRVVPCWTRLPYMCYKNATATPTSQPWSSPPTTDVTLTSQAIDESTTANEPWFSLPTADDTSIDESTTDVPTADCSSGYKLYANGRCYKMHNYMLTSWHDANRICTEEGGYLAIINDSAEARLITEICFPDKSPFTFIWIGLHDITGNRDWRSVHGDHLHVLYNIGDLNNSRFDCGAIKYTGKLYDLHCGDSNSFICEKKL